MAAECFALVTATLAARGATWGADDNVVDITGTVPSRSVIAGALLVRYGIISPPAWRSFAKDAE
jgi:hypothetical protein